LSGSTFQPFHQFANLITVFSIQILSISKSNTLTRKESDNMALIELILTVLDDIYVDHPIWSKEESPAI